MTGKDVAELAEARPVIPAGTKVNITYLGTEGFDVRLRAAAAVKEAGFQPIPHIAARRLTSRSELERYLAALQRLNASAHVFVVGGDPATPEGPYDSALALIESGLLGRAGVRSVGISGYPDGHPGIPAARLWTALDDKAAALAAQGLAGSITTQFGFDVDRVVAWLTQLRQRGINLPVRIGVPGPAGIRRLLSYATRFGVSASAGIARKFGFSLTNLLGTVGPEAFVTELAQRSTTADLGEVLVHFYTFGGLRATAGWVHEHGATR
ncbi:methylenetetrahydrofolate reductase [Mycobacterium stomatepiae]|nr:methylenetetrahydrofolate reductase [Mycobacterium stomatepiae]